MSLERRARTIHDVIFICNLCRTEKNEGEHSTPLDPPVPKGWKRSEVKASDGKKIVHICEFCLKTISKDKNNF